MVNGEAVYKCTPAEFVAKVPTLIEAGASFVGGCCGTDPRYLEALAAMTSRKVP